MKTIVFQSNKIVFREHPDHYLPALITNVASTLQEPVAGMDHNKALRAFMHEENRSLLRFRAFGGTILRSYQVKTANIEQSPI